MFKITSKKTINQNKPKMQFQNSQINNALKWLNNSKQTQNQTDEQLIIQNKKILQTLKFMAVKLNKQLENTQTKAALINLNNQNKNNVNLYQLLTEKAKNNQKLITSLENDVYTMEQRLQKISDGLQSKTTQRKFAVQKKIQSFKNELKKMKLQQKQVEKRLVNHKDENTYEGFQQRNRLQQQLRCASIKYVRLLDKYNKSIQKLAVASSIQQIPDHQFQVPEQIYNQQLEKREKQQYKQYEDIIKICTILQKRNQSQHNKANRIYNQRLRQLERLINNLGQTDRIIAQRQGELIQSRKYIEMIKHKMSTGDIQIMRESIKTSNDLLRSKSYSSVKLFKQNNQIKKRGYSFARILPAKINVI